MASGTEARYEKEFRKYAGRIGLVMMALDEMMDEKEFDKMNIREIRVKGNTNGEPGALAVVKAIIDGQLFVGFSQGMTPSEAIASAVERVKNNSMKWREDRPYNPQ